MTITARNHDVPATGVGGERSSAALAADTESTERAEDTRAEPQVSKAGLVIKWASVSLAVYLLITAVNLISSGFGLAAGDAATQLFSYVDNVFIALSIGILATVLTQSSSITTSITVGLVASGMPLSVAVPILLGANLGTTVTSTLVALAAVPAEKGDREVFRRSFSAASVHDFFNVLAVGIFLPLELVFGILERVSGALVSAFEQANGGADAASGVLIAITDAISLVFSATADGLLSVLVFAEPNTVSGVVNGVVICVIALVVLIFSIRTISKTLSSLLVGRVKQAMDFAISRNTFSGVISGALITGAVQSSSATTSLAVPLVGSGSFTLRQIYPFVVGANIGTTSTALLVGITMVGSPGSGLGVIALQAALVHAVFNLLAAALIMPTPVLRNIPICCAQSIGDLAVRHRMLAVGYTVSMFLLLPALVLGIALLV